MEFFRKDVFFIGTMVDYLEIIEVQNNQPRCQYRSYI